MWAHSGAASEMHVGDLAWGTFRCWPSALDAVRLWTDPSGRAQALAMFRGAGVCDLVVRPGAAGLEAATHALDWAEQLRRSAAAESAPTELRVGRRVDSTALVRLLRARGFERCAGGVPVMSRTITAGDFASTPNPSGSAIRELRADDIAARAEAFNAAFPGEVLEPEAYRALRRCSVYDPRLDVVATVAGSGIVAFVTLWLDPRTSVVQIEPAGCHPDHRRRGLTRAVIAHALRRAVGLGATEAVVRHVSSNVAARALYQCCGFATVSELTGFAKTLGPPQD